VCVCVCVCVCGVQMCGETELGVLCNIRSGLPGKQPELTQNQRRKERNITAKQEMRKKSQWSFRADGF